MATGLLHEAGQGGVEEEEATQGMAELLEGETPNLHFRRGDILDGVVMRADRESILVDIGGKTEGIIPGPEMRSLGADGLSQTKIGDEILVYVLQEENQEGQVVLSLDRAIGEKGWRTLQQIYDSGEALEAEVVGYNKGGLLVNIEGVRGFVPISQVVGMRLGSYGEAEPEVGFTQWIGKQLRLKIIEHNRRRNRLILSERAALQDWRAQQKTKLLSELTEGEIRRGKVTSIRSFGAFIDLGGADGLAHFSELSWGKIRSPEDVVKVGDEVDVFVLKVEPETQKISLSLKRAQADAWESVAKKYTVGQLVTGTITKLTSFGAFAQIEGLLEGLIHISEMADRRISHPREVVKEGDVLTLKIVKIERDRYRFGLSLKQALEDLEGVDREAIREQLETLVKAREGGATFTIREAVERSLTELNHDSPSQEEKTEASSDTKGPEEEDAV